MRRSKRAEEPRHGTARTAGTRRYLKTSESARGAPPPARVSRGRGTLRLEEKPGNPERDEVRAITENHAEKVADLMETVAALEKRPT